MPALMVAGGMNSFRDPYHPAWPFVEPSWFQKSGNILHKVFRHGKVNIFILAQFVKVSAVIQKLGDEVDLMIVSARNPN